MVKLIHFKLGAEQIINHRMFLSSIKLLVMKRPKSYEHVAVLVIIIAVSVVVGVSVLGLVVCHVVEIKGVSDLIDPKLIQQPKLSFF